MVRLAASLVGLVGFLAMLVLPAMAGDRAQINVIGYSADGSYFAFEEFGIQDGSGFAYSSVYLVDLVDDSWVIGTPFRVLAEDENMPLAEIRVAAQAKAADNIAMLGIDVPGEFVAMIGDGVPDADAKTLTFGTPGPAVGSVTGAHTLALTQFETRAAAPCVEWFSSPAHGYQLSISNYEGNRVVHRDDSLPRSRGCPVDYRLFGVVLPFADTPLSHAVGIISVYTFGFEGPDRRFIAVPLGF
ncbi:MAG: DUF2259 domain-containing protein [Devosia sp.]